MTLHCESVGAGPDIVLVHGWAWHSGVWSDVVAELANDYRVWTPDLPGHGRSRDVSIGDMLGDWTSAVCASVPAAATWIGWSLGADIAISAALRGYARQLILVNATPRFVQGEDWKHAVSSQWFDEFSAQVSQDAKRALERFSSLHLAGLGNERRLLRRLRAELVRHDIPDRDALQAGLQILKQTDFRAQLPALNAPALVMHGELDQVIPSAAGEWIAQALPQATFQRIADAGHAPFLSHSTQFMETTKAFLHG